MKVTIDRSGRLLVPKPVRDRLGLRAGTDLELEVTSAGLLLKPGVPKPSLVKEGDDWVHLGELPPGFDVLNALEDDREERMRKNLGL